MVTAVLLFQNRLIKDKINLDKAAAYVFPGFFFLFNLIYWIYYLLESGRIWIGRALFVRSKIVLNLQ